MPIVDNAEKRTPNIRIASTKQPIFIIMKMIEGESKMLMRARRSEIILARPEKPLGVMPDGVKKVRKAKPIINAPSATIKHWKTKTTYLFLINSLMRLFYNVLIFFQSKKIYICKKIKAIYKKIDFFVDKCVE